MQKITIHTGLEDFLMIDEISQVGARDINGRRTFTDAPVYLGLEALAQLGATHVRYLMGFRKHAFLLKITRWSVSGPKVLNGTYDLSGRLISRSSSAFSHILEAKKHNQCRMKGEFLFATIDYDHRFKKDELEPYFRARFSCLENDSKID